MCEYIIVSVVAVNPAFLYYVDFKKHKCYSGLTEWDGNQSEVTLRFETENRFIQIKRKCNIVLQFN